MAKTLEQHIARQLAMQDRAIEEMWEFLTMGQNEPGIYRALNTLSEKQFSRLIEGSPKVQLVIRDLARIGYYAVLLQKAPNYVRSPNQHRPESTDEVPPGTE